MSEKPFPLIMAHRGASTEAYENSMEAFQLAVDQKADMIELDVHLTKDNQLLVHHDKDLKFDNQVFPIKFTTLEKIRAFRLPNFKTVCLPSDIALRPLVILRVTKVSPRRGDS